MATKFNEFDTIDRPFTVEEKRQGFATVETMRKGFAWHEKQEILMARAWAEAAYEADPTDEKRRVLRKAIDRWYEVLDSML